MSLIEDIHAPGHDVRPVFLTALAVIGCLILTFGGWGMYAHLDSAVVAHGTLLAESERKTVEHFEGGILRQLLVKSGDRVEAGQVVALLDATQTEAQLAQLDANSRALALRIWRLAAEEDGATSLDPATAPAFDDPGRAAQVAAEVRLFDARLRAHVGGIASLRRQIDQLAAQERAATAQADAAARQLALWRDERASSATLVEKGATPRQKLLELDRNIALLEGDRDEQAGLAAAAREDMARARTDIETMGQQRLADVGEELSESRRQLAEVTGQIRGAEDVLERRKLRAPQAGLVVQINTISPGAVVGSGAPVMEIVPDADRLVAEVHLPTDSIDTVRVGRPAKVKLSAYKRAKAPTVEGEVIYVSADVLTDERDGSEYYDAKVSLDTGTLKGLDHVTLTPGMPVEVAIRTGERRAADYFLEPILRHFGRALREE
ncbi:MAG: HlyD family type I secretion periplasmic adaptor subunit [Amaricoccus sp.]|uniref:HlyD family type I secretion periplasmic adaptor subunit n=1 Tax=Amaricoccus sp. TaxID=1872485 RepID=UPI0039E6FCF3